MDRLSSTLEATRTEAATVRFLRQSAFCRETDLAKLVIVTKLVKDLSELVHSLQRERGISAVFLGSGGALFAERRAAQVAGSLELECRIAGRLEHIDEELERCGVHAGLYVRMAFACTALGSLAAAREQVAALAPAPQDTVKTFTDIIGSLLGVGLEAANIAADPELSRLLIALVCFSQGKEYAGQERAAAGAWLSRGRCDPAERRRLKQVQAAQEQAFQLFARFAGTAHVEAHHESMSCDLEAVEFARARELIVQEHRGGWVPLVPVEQWYERSTRRIDRMKAIEARLGTDLGDLCAAKLAEVRAQNMAGAGARTHSQPSAPVAMLMAEIEEQSRQIDTIHSQLDSTRLALAQRKTVERAKGVLMRSQKLSENDAHALMRRTAMKQNKRLYEVAAAILTMAHAIK